MINPLITSELLFEGAEVPLHLIYLVFYLKLATPTTEKQTRYRGTNKHHRVHPGIFSQVCISLTRPPRPCWSDSPATSVPFCMPPLNAQALVSWGSQFLCLSLPPPAQSFPLPVLLLLFGLHTEISNLLSSE